MLLDGSTKRTNDSTVHSLGSGPSSVVLNPFPDANGNPTFSADGFYHPEDEAFLPWFMRTSPNTVSELTQHTSANVGV